MAKDNRKDVVAELMLLFPGNQRASGRYDLQRDRNWTEDGPARDAHWETHLKGTVGLGVIPIQDDDNCQWGCIDLDNHGSDEDLPIHEIETLSRERGLPLIMCRSKSGGVHAYFFMDRPHPAAKVQSILTRWADTIGYPKAEVFPKQARLVASKGGDRPTGNYVNMPYMGDAATVRYAVFDGKKLSLAEFLELAKRNRLSGTQLRATTTLEHPEAPPCIQRMMQNGVAQGQRNEALYNTVVYFKKMDPTGFEARANDANTTLFNKPLPRAETGRTIASAARPDCGYRCNEEPLRTLCDRDTCLKRKFGITPADAERLATTESLPTFAGLVKYMSDPVRWEVSIDDVRITNVSTEQLLDWRAMRILIAERLTKIVPALKAGEWERILNPIMKEARIVEAPDDASVAGSIRARLREFAARTELTNRGEDLQDRDALLRGLPVVQKYEGDRMVFFRAEDFINYLKRTKSEELKGVNLWFAVKKIGVNHTKLRAGKQNINLWYLPVSQVLNESVKPQAAHFESDL